MPFKYEIIRIDDDVFARLAELRRPADRSWNAVLRRVFDLEPKHTNQGGRGVKDGARRFHMIAVTRDGRRIRIF